MSVCLACVCVCVCVSVCVFKYILRTRSLSFSTIHLHAFFTHSFLSTSLLLPSSPSLYLSQTQKKFGQLDLPWTASWESLEVEAPCPACWNPGRRNSLFWTPSTPAPTQEVETSRAQRRTTSCLAATSRRPCLGGQGQALGDLSGEWWGGDVKCSG